MEKQIMMGVVGLEDIEIIRQAARMVRDRGFPGSDFASIVHDKFKSAFPQDRLGTIAHWAAACGFREIVEVFDPRENTWASPARVSQGDLDAMEPIMAALRDAVDGEVGMTWWDNGEEFKVVVSISEDSRVGRLPIELSVKAMRAIHSILRASLDLLPSFKPAQLHTGGAIRGESPRDAYNRWQGPAKSDLKAMSDSLASLKPALEKEKHQKKILEAMRNLTEDYAAEERAIRQRYEAKREELQRQLNA